MTINPLAIHSPNGLSAVMNENHDEEGWLSVEKLNDKYPGFIFISGNYNDVCFENHEGKKIIEFLGKPYPYYHNGRYVLYQNNIATLRDADADLYAHQSRHSRYPRYRIEEHIQKQEKNSC